MACACLDAETIFFPKQQQVNSSFLIINVNRLAIALSNKLPV